MNQIPWWPSSEMSTGRNHYERCSADEEHHPPHSTREAGRLLPEPFVTITFARDKNVNLAHLQCYIQVRSASLLRTRVQQKSAGRNRCFVRSISFHSFKFNHCFDITSIDKTSRSITRLQLGAMRINLLSRILWNPSGSPHPKRGFYVPE